MKHLLIWKADDFTGIFNFQFRQLPHRYCGLVMMSEVKASKQTVISECLSCFFRESIPEKRIIEKRFDTAENYIKPLTFGR